MQKQTTTKQLSTAIKNGLLQITKAEKYHKSTRQTETIDTGTFQESLYFLSESIFADCIGWHFERDINTGQYVTECSRKDGSVDLIIIAHLCARDSVNVEDVEKMLKIEEE